MTDKGVSAPVPTKGVEDTRLSEGVTLDVTGTPN